MEIFKAGRDAGQRLSELVDSGYEYVDGWDSASAELSALAALPHPPAGLPSDWTPGDERASENLSSYVIWPWRRTIARLPNAELFHVLRTARNRHLISDEDQRAWSDATVGIAGLSVGSAAAVACQLTGVRRFRLADGDLLGITNLNRIRDSAFGVGLPKTELARRSILECDPYADVATFHAHIGEPEAEQFLLGPTADRPLSVLIEEIDGLYMKVALRRHARRLRIPVVMATDLGDDVVIDVERFDLDDATDILGGRLAGFTDDDLRSRDPRTVLAGVLALLGDVVTPQLRAVAGELGRSLSSWPQLGTTAMLSGSLAAFAAREIVAGHDLPTGRYLLRTRDVFAPNRPFSA